MVAGILHLLGVDFGPEDGLIEGRKENPKGFWEHRELTNLSEQILRGKGGSWHRIPDLEPGWEESAALAPLRAEARALIQRDFADSSLWGWKDPRCCLTLPFWRTLVPDLRIVLCLRNPVDVASSLAQRNAFPPEISSEIWVRYMTAALKNTGDLPTLFFSFDEFFASPLRELERLARFAGVPDRAADQTVQTRVEQFAESGLRHHSTPLRDGLSEPDADYFSQSLYLLTDLLRNPGVDSDPAGRTEGERRRLLSDLADSALRTRQAMLPVEEEKRIHDLSLEITDLDEDNKILRKAIASLQASYFWKTWHAFNRVKDTLLPHNSWPRRIYDRALRRIKGSPGQSDEVGTAAPEAAPAPNIYKLPGAAKRWRRETGRPFSPSKLDIVVVTYNSSHYVRRLFGTILASAYPPEKMNVFFIDNGSADDSLDIIDSLEGKERLGGFQPIDNGENVGFGAGVNRAVSKGDSPHILVLNPDTELHADCIAHLMKAQTEDPEAWLWEARQLPYEHPKYFSPVTLETFWASGAAFLVRRDKFEALGGFDESFFLYAEDVDLSLRMRQLGGKLRYVPSAVVYHDTYSEKKIKRIQQVHSIKHNLLLRYRFGTPADIVKGYAKLFRLFVNGNSWIRGGRSELRKILASHFGRVGAMRRWRRQRRESLPIQFMGWDYEVTRKGAFYEHTLPTSTPLVSVVVRTRNRASVLEGALASLRNQTYPHLEVVVVEDGPECSAEKIGEFPALNVTYHFTGEPVGRTRAGNIGLELARGDFLAFLDDDDTLFPDHIEVLVSALNRHASCRLAYASSVEARAAKRNGEDAVRSLLHWSSPFDRGEFMFRNLFPIQAALFHRSLYEELGGLDESLDVLEDWDLWRRFATRTEFLFVEKTTSEFRTPHELQKRKSRERTLLEAYWTVSDKRRHLSPSTGTGTRT